jgi:hypothetical protein
MARTLRKSAILASLVLAAVSAFAENSGSWRTAADIGEGVRGEIIGTVTDIADSRNQLTIASDEDRGGLVTVFADSVSTQYNNFGGVINGKPEIFTGSSGFANIRLGDRIDVRGVGRAAGTVGADVITLLGRPVPASQVGVGGTRSPNQISTPATSSTQPVDVYGRVEGVVRQVDPSTSRITIETDRREMLTIVGNDRTPVYYGKDTYQIRNLEPGDRVRIDPMETSSSGTEVTARSIQVVQSAQDSRGGTTSRQVASISGRVTRIDRGNNVVHVNTGRGDVVVDLRSALDSAGRRVRAADMQMNDRVEVSGSYGNTGSMFVASTVRWADEVPGNDNGGTYTPPASSPTYGGGELVIIPAFNATVVSSLAESTMLVVRDSTGRTLRLNVVDDFPVRTRGGGYTTASNLRNGENVIVKAYRDASGNYIAQTIRMR